MIHQKEKTRAILLLLILIAIGGIVLYGTEKIPNAPSSPHYESH